MNRFGSIGEHAIVPASVLSLVALAVSGSALAGEAKAAKTKAGTTTVHRERGADGLVDKTMTGSPPVQFLRQFHQCNMYWPDTTS